MEPIEAVKKISELNQKREWLSRAIVACSTYQVALCRDRNTAPGFITPEKYDAAVRSLMKQGYEEQLAVVDAELAKFERALDSIK